MSFPITGHILKAHIPWLEAHGHVNKEGALVCKHTQTRLYQRVVHRMRPKENRIDDTYLDAALLDDSGFGEMISFTAYWCGECKSDNRPKVPAGIGPSDIVKIV